MSDIESDSEDQVDVSEIDLICDCEDIVLVNEDEDEMESSFSRASDDICWVNTTRLGVPTKCSNDDLITVAVGEDDIMTFCRQHFKRVQQHHCCWHCFNLVVAGTFLKCPEGHRTDPLCKTIKQKMDEGEPRSCSHCGSTDLQMNQLQFALEDSDESCVTEFVKIIEELEKAEKEGVVQPRSVVDQWKERLRVVAPDILIAFRHSPQSVRELATRMYDVLSLVDNEEVDLIEKLVDLRGVAKPGELVSSVSESLKSISYDGELPFKYTDVVADLNNLTKIKDQKSTMFCDCVGPCVPGKCECCSGEYAIDDTNNTFIEQINPMMPSISECGPSCGCSTECGNRLVQSGGKRYKLEIFETRDRGQGVRAKETIPAGRFIIEYTGVVRKLDNGDITNNYCFETVLGFDRVEIDAREMGSAARCINHSCAPNAVIVKVAWEPVEDRRLFHLAIFALEEIAVGKEITIDYGDGFWFAKMDEFACVCGAANCKHHEGKRQEKLAQFERTGGEEEEMDDEEEDEDEEEVEQVDDEGKEKGGEEEDVAIEGESDSEDEEESEEDERIEDESDSEDDEIDEGRNDGGGEEGESDSDDEDIDVERNEDEKEPEDEESDEGRNEDVEDEDETDEEHGEDHEEPGKHGEGGEGRRLGNADHEGEIVVVEAEGDEDEEVDVE